jgi:hypothetical protein
LEKMMEATRVPIYARSVRILATELWRKCVNTLLESCKDLKGGILF